MVVGDDQVEAEGAGRVRFFQRTDAAVHGDDHAHTFAFKSVQSVVVETVALVFAVGDVSLDGRAQNGEDLDEEGGRGDAVGVVVAVDGDALPGAHGALEALHGFWQASEQERVVALRHLPGEEQPGLFGGRKAAVEQQLGDDRRVIREGRASGFGQRRGDDPAFRGHADSGDRQMGFRKARSPRKCGLLVIRAHSRLASGPALVLH
ncbi:MAG: hypothetical protein HW418_4227, partial [Anaerolineales bacterium]|nr:hypothetical protein [Anaerolineales bacterium]